MEVEPLSDAALHQAVVEVQKQIDCLSARQAELLAAWNTRKVWADNGSRSATSRLSRETGLSLADAGHLLKRARRLSGMPRCAEAFANGDLSTSRVDLLVSANEPDVADVFARDEKLLLQQASGLRFADAKRALDYWTQLANEQKCEDKGKRLVQQRSASTSRTFEGSVDLRTLFDPISGEIFLNEFERIERQLFEADWAEAKARFGDAVTVDDLTRTASQRRCDALVEMAKRSAAVSQNTKPSRPLISVVVDYETFGRVCELGSGTVVAPGQLVPLLSETEVERIVFDGKTRVIEMGTQRSFRGALRRALEIRDRHCQHPSGCDVLAKNCQSDHTVAYIKGGLTVQSNGRLLCAFHNRAKGSDPP